MYMEIPLDQFEGYIDETILQRGLSYFKNGNVNEPDEIRKGVFEFIIRGTKNYNTLLTIKRNIVKDYSCDCPYDMGPVCKHVAAAIFFLQKEILGLNQKSTDRKKERGMKTVKKKTVAEQVNDLLNTISHEDIKQYIREKAEQDSSFRNMFIASFAHQNENESKEIYLKQIRTILNNAADRNGFIDWSGMNFVGNVVAGLLKTAQKHFGKHNYKSSIYICLAVMEQMTAALQYSDDSNGEVSGSINDAYDILYKITSENLNEETRKLLFDYFLSAFEEEIYSGWDWHFGMLELAVRIFTDDNEAQRIISQLDKKNLSDYNQEIAQNIRLQIIMKTKGEKEGEKYLEQNISNSDFRRKVITNAIKNKNFDKAILIAKEGIKQDEKNKPGLLKDWYNFLLKIAQIQKDKEKVVEYARLLFIDNFSREQDYYKILKDNIPSEKWSEYVEDIIKEISEGNRHFSSYFISDIYIKECWWDRLFEMVKKDPSLTNISQYEQYLSKDYAVEITELYEAEINKSLVRSADRHHYAEVCRYLRRMIKLGAREKVDSMIEKFRKEYARRPALLDELKKV